VSEPRTQHGADHCGHGLDNRLTYTDKKYRVQRQSTTKYNSLNRNN